MIFVILYQFKMSIAILDSILLKKLNIKIYKFYKILK